MKTLKIKLKTVKVLFVLFILSVFSINSFSQETTETISVGKRITIDSKILNQKRVILISTPDNYKNSDKKYPVLYVLDGRTHFKHVTAGVDYLSKSRLTPEMIVVAITNIDRGHDFTPKHDNKMPTSGGGEKFHNFITKELFKYMKKNYKVTNYRILMGHSLGGMFAAYSLLQFPDAFNSYIAISPYMQMADNHLIKEAEIKLQASYKKTKSYYMTVGDEPRYFEPLKKFSTLVENKSGDAINFSYVKMKGDNHMVTPYLSLFNGLRFIFSDWGLSTEVFNKGIASIDNHFKYISKKYGLNLKTPENTINFLGYNRLNANKINKAIEIFKENVKRYPKSANVYDSLGEAYEKNKQFKLAKKNYKKAYDIGITQAHRATLVFKKNYERVAQLIEK